MEYEQKWFVEIGDLLTRRKVKKNETPVLCILLSSRSKACLICINVIVFGFSMYKIVDVKNELIFMVKCEQ